MTRKDYVLLAVALSEARSAGPISSGNPEAFYKGCDAAAKEIADALARENPRFERERFLKAAGVQS